MSAEASRTQEAIANAAPSAAKKPKAVAFGFLNRHLGLILGLTPEGRSDENRQIGSYVPGNTQNHPIEGVLVKGTLLPILRGQSDKEGQRKDGIVLIDATNFTPTQT
ncbi:hypothetical protein [Microvirga tunisiensis]|uniref:Uncharacterized protein n=1 Tax=Microvirga tunisiensis TaxID=2108360 RepID=A0A5N7MAD8_9HYPH|nr:hypothetical protein [Microvirga tunisiensis]MPR05672.1 hypothetical protein [Microvirga tunisiensis]MPR23872.1 hypothetical protein [Microvirga tunisiensis]